MTRTNFLASMWLNQLTREFYDMSLAAKEKFDKEHKEKTKNSPEHEKKYCWYPFTYQLNSFTKKYPQYKRELLKLVKDQEEFWGIDVKGVPVYEEAMKIQTLTNFVANNTDLDLTLTSGK